MITLIITKVTKYIVIKYLLLETKKWPLIREIREKMIATRFHEPTF